MCALNHKFSTKLTETCDKQHENLRFFDKLSVCLFLFSGKLQNKLLLQKEEVESATEIVEK